MHALIIEDQFLISAWIEDVLRELGYESFDTVDTEAAAVRAARKRCPDLITVDEKLSQGSGISAIRTICADRAIPAIFITQHRAEVRRKVPHAILIDKPFGARALHDAVDQAVRSFAEA